MKTKGVLPIILVVPIILLLCGFSFKNVTVVVDTEKNQVYEYKSADDVLNDFAKDPVAAKNKYNNGYYVISGKIESISDKGDKISLYGSSNKASNIICSCPKQMREEATKYNVDDGIGVYGKLSVDPIDKEIHIKVDKLIDALSGVKTGTFYLLEGNSINKNSMSTRTLKDGKVSFKIPAEWKGIEHSIIEDGIGTIDGYQYVLNELQDHTDTVPESFFVCYFDNASKLEKTYDKKKTELIEKAIINNISGERKGDSADTKNVNTYYGAEYNYFTGISYTDLLDENGYHVEYIFQKDGEDGLVMYLYVYKEPKHLSDILFVTRFLEMSSQ